MKRILFWSAVTVLAAVSCNKIENDAPAQVSNVPAFEASVDGADTKTVIDGMKSYWDGTEGIRVFDGALAKGKVYTAKVNKAETATFTENDGTVVLKGDDYLAVYPEGPAGDVTWAGDVASAAKKFWLPGDQIIAVAGSYDPSTHIAVAYTEAGNNNLEFKNVNAFVKVNLTSDNVTEICFYGNNSDVIAGNFEVTYNEGNPTVNTKNQYNLTYAKVKAAKGTLAKGTYYISVLPCTLSKGFSIETVSNGVKSVKKNSSSYLIARNQIVDLGDIEWVAPAESSSRTIYLNAKTYWDVDGAVFMAHFWGGAGVNPSPVLMTKDSGNTYKCQVDANATDIIFVRKDPKNTDTTWNGEWGRIQTTLSADKDLFTVTSYTTGTWSKK